MRRYRLKYLHRNREVTQFTVGADSISARLFWLNRSPRRTTDGRPYGYGGNRLFHRSRGVNKFIVGEGFPLPPFVLIKPFVHGSSKAPTPTVYGDNRLFHRNREVYPI